jgi:catechol O-methyltransferase
MNILNRKMEAVLEYVLSNAKQNDPQSILDVIDDYAMGGSLDNKRFLMNVGPEKGKILEENIKKHNPKKILELGAFLGYSAVLIGMSMHKDSTLVSVDPDDSSIIIASKIVDFAGMSEKISFIKKKAEDAIDGFKDQFDFVFIDHAKKRYFPDLILLEKANLLKKNSVIFADNVGLFKEDMNEYLNHVRDSGIYDSKNISAHLEYRDNIYDAVEISIFK